MVRNIVRSSALWLIRAYQVSISPLFGKKCRFIPTCSQYTYEAIEIHGFWKGIWLGVKRILKCHPFHPVMYDPVPNKESKCKQHQNKH